MLLTGVYLLQNPEGSFFFKAGLNNEWLLKTILCEIQSIFWLFFPHLDIFTVLFSLFFFFDDCFF